MNILKPITCKDGKVYGKVSNMAQYLNGSPDCRQYEVVCILDGTPLSEVVKYGFAKAVIESRKFHKTPDAVGKLKLGVHFMAMVNASPKDANQLAAALRVDEMSVDAAKALQKQLDDFLAAKASVVVDDETEE